MKRVRRQVLDQDMAKVGIALRRASKQARKIALQTNPPLVIYDEGWVIKKEVRRGEGT
jgi:hypothetical protein